MKSAQRFLLAVIVLLFARPAAATIGYHISLKNPEQHEFHVSMQIPTSELRSRSRCRYPGVERLIPGPRFCLSRPRRARNRIVRAVKTASHRKNSTNKPGKFLCRRPRVAASHKCQLHHRMGRSRPLQFATRRSSRLREFRRSADVHPHATRRRHHRPIRRRSRQAGAAVAELPARLHAELIRSRKLRQTG